MAILKHISVKNRFYSDAVEYLTCQFDEYTNKPILDGKGRIMERENYLIDGVNCDVDSFGAECIETNRFYGKNNSVNDVKAHHYIISFEPEDDITMEQAMEFGKKWLAEFAPGHQAVVAVHPDGHNNSRNMHIHMVINSVRKFPGRKSIWHDKPCEWKQCCKHKSTGKMMYHAKKWVMDKCIRLGLGQADLLARKHKDNYWVEKRLMDKNASDGVGVTSDRELIRNTIDKILPTVNSFEQLIEYLRAIYHWTIRVTNKTVTFAMPDMKKGIRGNKLGEGYGKAELTLMGTLAQNEVESTSKNVKLGIKMKMKRGELMGFNGCLGYDYHPEDKTITVNEAEAETVRLIFELYLQGYGTYTIYTLMMVLPKRHMMKSMKSLP